LSQADLRKWDERYRAGSYASRTHPTPLLEQLLASLPRGRALDVACGAGRNALCLAAAGFAVDAVDISPSGLERARATSLVRGLEVNWIAADLEQGLANVLAPEARYSVIVMVRYVNSALMPALVERLADGGVLVCEQHLVSDRDVVGPRNPAYRLGPNELLRVADGLRVLFYREGIVEDPDRRRAALAQLVAERGTAAEIVYC